MTDLDKTFTGPLETSAARLEVDRRADTRLWDGQLHAGWSHQVATCCAIRPGAGVPPVTPPPQHFMPRYGRHAPFMERLASRIPSRTTD